MRLRMTGIQQQPLVHWISVKECVRACVPRCYTLSRESDWFYTNSKEKNPRATTTYTHTTCNMTKCNKQLAELLTWPEGLQHISPFQMNIVSCQNNDWTSPTPPPPCFCQNPEDSHPSIWWLCQCPVNAHCQHSKSDKILSQRDEKLFYKTH